MRTTTVVLVCLFAFSVFATAPASGSWSLHLSGGATFPTQDVGETELGTGLGLEALVGYRFMPHLEGYAGWDYHHFGADESATGDDVDTEETGYAFGLRFVHPIGESALSYVARAGATYNHIEMENDDGDIIADSGHGLGWEAGVGLDIPIGDSWSVVPMVRYRSLSREIEIEDEATDVDLTYVATDLGITWSF